MDCDSGYMSQINPSLPKLPLPWCFMNIKECLLSGLRSEAAIEAERETWIPLEGMRLQWSGNVPELPVSLEPHTLACEYSLGHPLTSGSRLTVSAVSFRWQSILLAIRCVVASNHSTILISRRASWHLDFSRCLYAALPFTITPHCDHFSTRSCGGLFHKLWFVSVHFLTASRVTQSLNKKLFLKRAPSLSLQGQRSKPFTCQLLTQ